MVSIWGTSAAVRTGAAGWAAFREARETIGLNLSERGMDGRPPIGGGKKREKGDALRKCVGPQNLGVKSPLVIEITAPMKALTSDL